ncbi:DUF1513 domain-containing protein [Oceanibaculum pacificum]|uniref:Twin-arginine translocation pathway signal n=1 Tax=Oceanibaculum pacificum TaxID=580166 RepID=A0A154WFB9_9PROT|nr:DUF1513 domain-containing protein [Oceanibaculum pacificum]KZD12221.1 hypothetical protein AUP43_17120 [Oceanibaculum pacificum]
MMLSRRALLTRSALAGLAAAGAVPLPLRAAAREPLYLSARADDAGRFYAAAFDDAGNRVFDLPLPARGHGATLRPGGAEAVFMARRPGNFALVVDLAAGVVRHTIANAEDRNFAGHGLYVDGGRILLATEMNYAGELGVIGLYDAEDNYRRLGEMPSGGLDPHDLRLLPDGRTIIVANGGILTHPDAPRAKLNLMEMDSSVAFIDWKQREIVAQHRLEAELFQLSLRHMAVTATGEVGIAMQYEGPSGDLVPLVALASAGGLELLELPDPLLNRLNNYCGSAAVDSSGAVLGVSSPRGGRAIFWDVAARRLLGSVEMADCCGLTAAGPAGGFLLSSGMGDAIACNALSGASRRLHTLFLATAHWDNHMVTA